MTLVAGLLAMLVLPVTACESDNGNTLRFPLQHLSAEEAVELVRPYTAAQVSMRMDEERPVLDIRADAEQLAEIEGVLERHDVPRQVRLRFQLVEADGFTTADPAIAEVESALRELFRFSGYRLVAEAMMTTTQHSSASQRLIGFDGEVLHLHTRVGAVGVTRDPGSVEMNVELAGEAGVLLSTRVIVPAGQTVVLGTARPSEGRGALILVVRPEIQ
jgi:hypothetical protein